MSVYRTTELPISENVGRLIVPEAIAAQTKAVLQHFSGPDGRHEGLVFWLGRRIGNDSLVISLAVPNCEHGPARVMTSEKVIGKIMKESRKLGLAIAAQVHSHPGNDTRHSEGDDKLVLMPFDGMFSLVISNYGMGGMTQEAGAGLHQFQNGQWVQISRESTDALIVAPTNIGVVS